jgi:hypothetical protein
LVRHRTRNAAGASPWGFESLRLRLVILRLNSLPRKATSLAGLSRVWQRSVIPCPRGGCAHRCRNKATVLAHTACAQPSRRANALAHSPIVEVSGQRKRRHGRCPELSTKDGDQSGALPGDPPGKSCKGRSLSWSRRSGAMPLGTSLVKPKSRGISSIRRRRHLQWVPEPAGRGLRQ